MKLAPTASITINFGGGQPVNVDYSLSATGADDTPQQVILHKAESAGVDFVKEQMQPEIDAVTAAIKQRLGLV